MSWKKESFVFVFCWYGQGSLFGSWLMILMSNWNVWKQFGQSPFFDFINDPTKVSEQVHAKCKFVFWFMKLGALNLSVWPGAQSVLIAE